MKLQLSWGLLQPLLLAAFVIGIRIAVRRFLARRSDSSTRSANRNFNASAAGEAQQPVAVISQLCIYPIKSCRGVSVRAAKIGPFGFENDRRFMVVGAESRRFVSQRVLPRMSLICVSFEERQNRGFLRVEWDHAAAAAAAATATAAAGTAAPPSSDTTAHPLFLPLLESAYASSELYEVELWDDKFTAIDCGDEAAEWFSAAVKRPVRLVLQPRSHTRGINPRYAANLTDSTAGTVAFSEADLRQSTSDGYPFLLTSESSLDTLNQSIRETCAMNHEPTPERVVQMRQFRPNIVVRPLSTQALQEMPPGYRPLAAWDEDAWRQLRIGVGNLHFFGVKPCERCKLPTVLPERGEFASNNEPTRTLERTRRYGGRTDVGAPVMFGMNLVAMPSVVGSVVSIDDFVFVNIEEPVKML